MAAQSRTTRGEDTKRNLKHAKRLLRLHVARCGAAGIDLDRGSAMLPPRRLVTGLGHAREQRLMPSANTAVSRACRFLGGA